MFHLLINLILGSNSVTFLSYYVYKPVVDETVTMLDKKHFVNVHPDQPVVRRGGGIRVNCGAFDWVLFRFIEGVWRKSVLGKLDDGHPLGRMFRAHEGPRAFFLKGLPGGGVTIPSDDCRRELAKNNPLPPKASTYQLLAKLPRLRFLDDAGATDEVTIVLNRNTVLESIDLRGRFTRKTILALLKYRRLRRLSLSSTTLTTLDLRGIEKLKTLEFVSLDKCSKVDDSVIDLLKQLPRLAYLDLSGTSVSPQVRKDIKALLPKTYVDFD